jgi:ribosomal protein L24
VAAGSFTGEAGWVSDIDGPQESVYIRNVPTRKVQVGQVWKKDDSSDSFLVTKIYNEALTSFAVLRKTGSETEPPIRIKISRSGTNATIPGFSYAQDSDDF